MQQQIDFLHNKEEKSEWCGLLIYKIEQGNINDPDNLVLLADGIYLMDVGSASHTAYDLTSSPEQTLDVYDRYPQLEEVNQGWRLGFIHTHHNMSSFFSGTDEKEQKDNTENYNIFLSLIVSFDLQYKARVSHIIEEETESRFSFKDIFNSPVNTSSSKKVNRFIAYYDCKVELDISIDQWFTDRLEAVKKSKAPVPRVYTPNTYAYGTQPYWNNGEYSRSTGWLGHNEKRKNTQLPLKFDKSAYSEHMLKKFCVKMITSDPKAESSNIWVSFSPYALEYDEDNHNFHDIIDDCIYETIGNVSDDKALIFLEDVYEFLHDDSFGEPFTKKFKGAEVLASAIFNELYIEEEEDVTVQGTV